MTLSKDEQNSSSVTCSNKYRNLDAYGAPVTFTYEGKKKFQTPVGATLTLMTTLILLSYGGLKLSEVLIQRRENLKIYHQTRNLFQESQFFDITNSDFQLAIGNFYTEVPPEIGSYFAKYVTVEWNNGERDK